MRFPAPKTTTHVRTVRRGTIFTASMAGAAFGACALCCNILGADLITQAWAAVALVSMIHEGTRR